MSLFQPMLLRSVFWFVAWIPLLSFQIGKWAVLGGLVSAALVSLTAGKKWHKAILHRSVFLIFMALTLVFIGPILSAPGVWIRLGLDLERSLEIHQVILGFSLVFASIIAGQSFSRWPLGRFGEALCMMGLLAAIFSEHRHGMIQEPRWLMDIFIEWNWNVLKGLRIGGFFAAFVAMVYLISSAHADGTGGKWKRFTTLLMGTALFWMVLDQIGSPSVLPPREEPPPLSSDLPPPPPPPDRVALVTFEDWFRTPKEILFSLVKVNPDSAARHVRTNEKTIQTRVHLLVEMPSVPALIGTVASETLKARSPFVAAYGFRSIPSLGDPTEVLGPDELEDPSWSPEQKKTFIEFQPNPKVDLLVSEIIKDEPLAGGKIAKIKEWMEQNIPVSEKAGRENPEKPIQDVIVEKQPCGMEQLTRAFVDMLRRAAVPAKLNEGFVYAPGPEFKKEILLTSQHRQHWAEVFLTGSGWSPVVLHPDNVLDRTEPPPQPDLEELLARLHEQEVHEPAFLADQELEIPAFHFAMASVVGLFFLALHPLFLALSRRPQFSSLRHELRMLRLSGFERGFGESWEEFIERTASHSRTSSRALSRTLKLLKTAKEGDGKSSRIESSWQACKIWWNLPWLLTQRIFRASTQN